MTYDGTMTENASPMASKTLFDQVAREPRLSDKVAEMMLDTILSNRLNVGDRLPSERELGEQFGVSRTVVREAVRALVAKGVIEVRSGSGLVSQPSTRMRCASRCPCSYAGRIDRLRQGQRGALAARGAYRGPGGGTADGGRPRGTSRDPRPDEARGRRRPCCRSRRSRVPPADRRSDSERTLPRARWIRSARR